MPYQKNKFSKRNRKFKKRLFKKKYVKSYRIPRPIGGIPSSYSAKLKYVYTYDSYTTGTLAT